MQIFGTRQARTKERIRKVFARIASPYQGERQAAADMAQGMIRKHGFSLRDLMGAQTAQDRETLERNFKAAQRIWTEKDKPSTGPKAETKAKATQPGRIWIEGYTRKDGTQVKGHWRNMRGTGPAHKKGHEAAPDGSTKPGCTWVNGYTRSNGTVVKGHWRRCR